MVNQNAAEMAAEIVREAQTLNIEVGSLNGATLLDFGCLDESQNRARGGLTAGIRLAELCLGGLAEVSITSGRANVWSGPDVMVRSDHPLAACMGSQYAGWSLICDYVSPTSGKTKQYFAMASGPMRAARGNEKVLAEYDLGDKGPDQVVGVLETRKKPPAEVVKLVAEQCGVAENQVTLAYAPTACVASSIQIAARSVETAMHKLHELGFDLRRVQNATGIAPLPPVAVDDAAAIGRTNDAVLYGGEVTLWVNGDDESIKTLGEQTPSSASRDYGEPFAEVFRRYGYDFYKVDPLLFSPAVVNFCNLQTGSHWRFGELRADVIKSSFGGH